MKFSELWLREWINPSVDSTTLINKITMAGLKVNVVEPVASCFNNVVVGNILDVNIHPKNSNLFINKIDIGNGCFFNVISKSRKCKKNLRVAVALTGAILPGDLQIQPLNIQGEWSKGMLCSFLSLGIIYNGVDDIIELPKDAPIGQDLKKYLQFDDKVIDIAITPNRGDCLNIMGMSHEIAAIYRLPLETPNINFVIPDINDAIPVSINVPNACPCYFSRIIKNIDTSVSTPLWMKEKLRRCGMQLINVVIDIINYVLLELGQPIHVFDLDSILGGISIRWGKQGEKLNLPYNKREIALTSEILVVADDIQTLGIAGILVGDAASIHVSKTCNIFLESAFFNSPYIIKSLRHSGFTTCSSYRYERNGVNPNISRLALERATFFLIDICGGVSGKVTSIIYKDMLPKQITITLHRLKLDRLLGYIIQDDEIVNILTHLGCRVRQEKKYNLWKVKIPVWRFDIKIEEDLIEEIVRLYGYDRMKRVSPYTALNIIKQPKNQWSLSRAKMLLVDLGYQEVITYSFVDPKMQDLLYPNGKSIMLLNPLTLDMSVMRSSLWIGLLKTVLYNQRRQRTNIRLFEYGACFIPDKNNVNHIHQYFMLSGIMTGNRFNEHWDTTPDMLDFYDIKGNVEALLEIHSKLNNIKFKSEVHSVLHPGQSAEIFLKEEYIGFIGLIHPVLEKKLNLKNRTFVFELLWEKISKNKIISRIVDVPKYPINRRDISIIVSDIVSFDEIILTCKEVIQEQLIDIKLFDVYRGKKISKGFKSLSIRLYIYHKFYTLKEEEIESIITKCLSALKSKFQACLRKK